MYHEISHNKMLPLCCIGLSFVYFVKLINHFLKFIILILMTYFEYDFMLLLLIRHLLNRVKCLVHFTILIYSFSFLYNLIPI